jgi:hypothetical protein
LIETLCFIHFFCGTIIFFSLRHPRLGVEIKVDYLHCCFSCQIHTVSGLNQVWQFINLCLWNSRKQNVEDWTMSERMGLHAPDRSFLAVPGAKELTRKIYKKLAMKRNLRIQDNLCYYLIIVMTVLWYYTLSRWQSYCTTLYRDDSLMVLNSIVITVLWYFTLPWWQSYGTTLYPKFYLVRYFPATKKREVIFWEKDILQLSDSAFLRLAQMCTYTALSCVKKVYEF